MKTITRDENDPVGGPAAKVYNEVGQTLIQELVQLKANGHDSPSEHLYVAVMGVSAAINIAAKIMTQPSDPDLADHWAESPSERTAILVACLLIARCSKPVPGGLDFEFGPRHILAAIEAAEKITGRNNDSVFSVGMVRAARRQEPVTDFFDNTEAYNVTDLSQYRTLN